MPSGDRRRRCALMSQPTINSDATNQTDVPVEEVDLLVVGGGKAGKSLAMLRAKAGDKVVMVERDKVGGTCINVACIPTKTLISAARVLREVQGSQAYGVTLPEQDGGADPLAQARIELASFRARKEAVVGGMVAAHEKMFPASGMDFVKGTARFVGERTVEIALNDGGLRRVRGAKVLINTGTTPSVPPIEGLSDVRYWTSEDLLTLPELPSSLIVLGGGVIGVEMASLMGLLGVPVTIVHAGPHILDREDEDVAAEVTAGLEALGVTVLVGARASKVAAAADDETGSGVDAVDLPREVEYELVGVVRVYLGEHGPGHIAHGDSFIRWVRGLRRRTYSGGSIRRVTPSPTSSKSPTNKGVGSEVASRTGDIPGRASTVPLFEPRSRAST